MKLDIEIASDLIAMLSLVIAIRALEISIAALHITLRKQSEAITWAHASKRNHRDTISPRSRNLTRDLGTTFRVHNTLPGICDVIDTARVVLPAFIQPALPITTSVRQPIAELGR
jgi:hypothetical protein